MTPFTKHDHGFVYFECQPLPEITEMNSVINNLSFITVQESSSGADPEKEANLSGPKVPV